ncbi:MULTISPECIES: thiamine-phosphate kinase [unclassified Amycolatopsis]|uniref:thiamine-phosphate kinase n=1 Tax=unclassified Amycolatopsis TaxID=2618356 RepID=UPI002875927B|nr:MULTISPECIES: thiamine-phosphate kinase [unclassified Amycolatopsis]MDS0136326.1 thiamine-monophosphate kinase [Amycolatopsis sp. 505]MDS0145841.1 thiamine-monophosphate kinase [Amycolatopsis sp. CM201R]
MSDAAERRLGDLGERNIQEHLLWPRYRGTEGFGDDSALLGLVDGPSELVATTDSCPMPVADLLGEPDFHHAGWLLATINLSDLAAAGAEPLGLVVNYTLPRTTTVREFERLLDGVDDCCAVHGTKVVGGDLRDGEVVQLTATAVGRCEPGRRLRRTGARAGDNLLLVGSPGYLWAAALVKTGRVTLPRPVQQEIWRRASRPMAQLRAGQLLGKIGLARAAMDVSDGLFATVRTLCEANDLGAAVTGEFELAEHLAEVVEQSGLRPFDLAQTWGDWGLVVVTRAEDIDPARRTLREKGISAQPIGVFTADRRITVGAERLPWRGIAQERFSDSSWHGGDLGDLIAAVLGALRS